MGGQLFGSLRGKLIASYALVIVLALVLAGSGFTYLIRAYQTQLRLNQLADVALPLAFQVRALQRAGASPAEMSQYLDTQANDLGVRILVIDGQRQIVLDTGNDLVGQSLPSTSEAGGQLGDAVEWGTLQVSDGSRMTFIEVGPRIDRAVLPQRALPRSLDLTTGVVILVPEQRVTEAWMQLAPDLITAAVAALVLSVGVAFFFARSIARPLAQVTQASERMAKGDFDQYIDVRGTDEIGQLAASFNTMAREVGRINRSQRDLLANVSHDLRTPLTSVEGFAAAMVDGTIRQPEDYREAAQIIGAEAERMHRLVEDLLYLSKIESGQIDLQLNRLALPDLLRTCVRQVQLQAENAGQTLSLDLPPVPLVSGDSHRLEQVFVNLLDNAVKHTPRGGQIEVKASAVAPVPALVAVGGGSKPSPGLVAVAVHNTGSYIPPDHLGRIFERFYQVDRARVRTEGSGLGLAIVHEIVQAHHGKVEVASDPQDGTTFTVYLPAAA